jgi:hypothetical protein
MRPRADDFDEATSECAAGTATVADDHLGAALLDALFAVSRARVLFAESTPAETRHLAARLTMLRAEVAALPQPAPPARIGFGPDAPKPRRKR